MREQKSKLRTRAANMMVNRQTFAGNSNLLVLVLKFVVI
jgi:hypothetical protein